MTTDTLMTPQELAEMLQVPQSTLYAWRSKGQGPPAYLVGKHLRYSRPAVLEWLDEQQSAAV